MPHPRFEEWLDAMRSGSAKQEQAWTDICAHAPELNVDEFNELVRSLEAQANRSGVVDQRLMDLNSKINLLIRLLAAQPWHREPQTTFGEWFFGPFRPRLSGARVSNPCVTIGVCDHEHIRDVQAQLILGRHLSRDRFPDTEFFHVPLRQPDWSDVGMDKINALCVVGRPSMFSRCPILQDLAIQHKNMRLSLPLDDEDWRSRPLTRNSAAVFHHVLQQPVLSDCEPYFASESDERRTDYAIVQRFNVEYGKRPVAVIVIAGTTSLGTVGAAEWVTNGELALKLKEACDRIGKTLREDTEMEALLKVTAEVRSPARPWATIGRTPIKLFLGDSVNAVGGIPSRITFVTRNGVPEMVLLDGDEVRFRGKAYSALVAICKVVCRRSSPHGAVLDLGELLADPVAVSGLGGHTSRLNLEIYLRDHLQAKHCLGNAVSIENGALKFHCEIHCIEHSGVSPA